MNSIKVWLVSNAGGRHIFYFELYTINKISGSLYFDSNLLFQVRHVKLLDLIELLIKHDLPLTEKEGIAAELFILIKKIKFYEQFYFDEIVLDKNGKLNIASYKVMDKLNTERLQNSYLMPLSAYSYPELFTVLKRHFHLHKDKIMSSSQVIIREAFEEQLINDPLKRHYLDTYNNSNMFYVYTDEKGEKTYFILNKDKLLFAFNTG